MADTQHSLISSGVEQGQPIGIQIIQREQTVSQLKSGGVSLGVVEDRCPQVPAAAMSSRILAVRSNHLVVRDWRLAEVYPCDFAEANARSNNSCSFAPRAGLIERTCEIRPWRWARHWGMPLAILRLESRASGVVEDGLERAVVVAADVGILVDDDAPQVLSHAPAHDASLVEVHHKTFLHRYCCDVNAKGFRAAG